MKSNICLDGEMKLTLHQIAEIVRAFFDKLALELIDLTSPLMQLDRRTSEIQLLRFLHAEEMLGEIQQ